MIASLPLCHDAVPVATPTERAQQIMKNADRAAWTAAALVIGLSDGGFAEHAQAAVQVLAALDIDIEELTGLDRPAAAASAAAPMLQTAAVLMGEGSSWAGQSDQALLAQGRASAQGAAAFAQFGLPILTGLEEMLASPGARMLDVGTGVAALAVAYAEQFPAVTVVGLDVFPRALALAAETVAASSVAADRVVLREQDVAQLDEVDRYALGWLPAPFLPESALRPGASRVAGALVPGGWLMVGHGKFTTDPVEDAITRFKTVAYGGTALDDDQAQSLLRDAGLIDVSTIPTPPLAPAITVGRKPG